MFNSEFYPTPKNIIEKMLQRYIATYTSYRNTDYKSLKAKRLLEPSAGKGDILDYVKSLDGKTEIFAIEIEPELRYVLQGKGYAVIDTDFLAYQGHHSFDMIVMNPPFCNGVDHLLKAWDIIEDGGDICCLLNAETIKNPFSRSRQLLLDIINRYGEYEFIGNAFDTAERKTDVEVVIVWLVKPESQSEINFDGIKFDRHHEVNDVEFSANPLAHANLIQALVDQYNAACRIIAEKHRLEKEYLFYIGQIMSNKDAVEKIPKSLNDELLELNGEFWKYVFRKTKISKVATSNFIKKFDEFSTATQKLAFTVNNIEEVLLYLMQNRGQIMQECLLTTFDTATAFDKKNKIYIEGWKTNSAYKVNKKIILPRAVTFETYGWFWNYYSRVQDFVRDIDKVLCYLTGRKDIETVYSVVDKRLNELNRGNNYIDIVESEFFKIRFFKKGTIHLTFKDLRILEKFNYEAAKGKMWLGDGDDT